ncbi:protein HAIKU1-like [Rutidosis leptorrhynchoides]|uniref:protein HAIKU1-like n=1 Tax=Rutidosis leptorrhynchoides TaxID=125765 RepID=UPI003A99300E
MDNSDYSRNRNNDYLGVNKIGKNIRKSPLHQPNFQNSARQQQQQHQPQVYNINKNDFQSIVQQLTGSPSRQSQEPLPIPPVNSPKPGNSRLQRIRPSPLTPLNVTRPRMPVHHAPQPPPPQEQMLPYHSQARPLQNGAVPFNGSNLGRPPQRPPPYVAGPPMNAGDHPGYTNIAESPISQYMRYLQHSINNSPQGHPPAHQQGHPPAHQQGHPQYQLNPQGQSQMQGQGQQNQHQYPLPSPRMNGGPPPLPSPRMNGGGPPLLPPLPSPRMNGPPPPLPSPSSQFLLPSPSAYLNLSSPRSPYPLLSPGYQNPPPLTPNFSFSPMNQPGAFNPGPQPPPSPGMGFPSPGFFSMNSPRWRD